jgi:hypothetical protein
METKHNYRIGDYVKTGVDWNIVTYLYGNEKMLACTGLGKAGDYPISISNITDHVKADKRSILGSFLGDKTHIFWDKESNRFYLVEPVDHFPSGKFKDENFGKGINVYNKREIIYNWDKSCFFSQYTNIAFCYQIDRLVKIKEYNNDIDTQVIFDDVKAFCEESFIEKFGKKFLNYNLKENNFTKLKESEIPQDIYWGMEKYHTIEV